MSTLDAARRIEALCSNPHWTMERKYRIAQLAQEIIKNESAPRVQYEDNHHCPPDNSRKEHCEPSVEDQG